MKQLHDRLRKFFLAQFQRHCTDLAKSKRARIMTLLNQIIAILKEKEE